MALLFGIIFVLCVYGYAAMACSRIIIIIIVIIIKGHSLRRAYRKKRILSIILFLAVIQYYF